MSNFLRDDGTFAQVTSTSSSGGNITGPTVTTVGDFVTWNSTDGTMIADIGATVASSKVTGTFTSTTITGTFTSTQTSYPLLPPNGSVSAPSYSWSFETNSGFYRNASHDIRYSINGADVFKVKGGILDIGGSNVSFGDPLTFYYPTFNASAASGVMLKVNRIQVGVEALEGTQYPQSPNSPIGGITDTASIAIFSQVGGVPINAASRTSDFRNTFGTASGGAGSYFFAQNDDTTGQPIVAALNATAFRSNLVQGTSEALQIDMNNQGSVVDLNPYMFSIAGQNWALNISPGVYGGTTNVSAALVFTPGASTMFRQAIIVQNGSLDTSAGSGGGGVFANLPRGASLGWTNSGGGIDSEMWANASGLTINSVLDVITALFSPIVAGGSGAASTLVIESTSGAGTTDAIIFKTASQVERMRIDTSGNVGVSGGTLGYSTGAGGAVVQLSTITSAVTLNKICGSITTVSNAFVTGTPVQFLVNNSALASTDAIIVTMGHTASATDGAYAIYAAVTGTAGQFIISIVPYVSQTATLVINFAIVKAVAS